MYRFTVILILLSFSFSGYSANPEDPTIDSLKSMYSKAKNSEDRFNLLIPLGKEYHFNKPDSCIKYLELARKIAIKIGDKTKIALSLYELARVNKTIGSYQIAKEYALQSYRMAEEDTSIRNRANASLILGNLSIILQDFPEARKYLHLCVDHSKASNFKQGIARSHLGLGNMYYFMDSLKEAKTYYELSLISLNEIKDNKGIAAVYVNVGNIGLTEGNYDEAIVNYSAALEMYKKLKLNTNLALTYYNLGDVYALSERYEEARVCFHESLKLGFYTGSGEDIKYAYKGLFDLHDDMGNLDSALHYSNLYHAFKDSLQDVEIEARVADLQARHESDRKSLELEETKKRLTVLDEQHISDVIAFWVSILASVIILIAALLFYRNLRRSRFKNLKLRLQSEHIHEKNRIIDLQLKDKDVLLKEVHHRVKNNLQMISSLLNLQSQRLRSEAAITALQESKDRVQAIALIHKGLYQNDKLAEIKLKLYIEELINYQRSLQKGVTAEVDFRMEIEDIILNIDTAVPLGLIISELISNSLKHAFPPSLKNPTITVAIEQTGEKSLQMRYSDNGVGMETKDPSEETESLGLEIVQALVEQLDGTLQSNVDEGTHFTVDFIQQKV